MSGVWKHFTKINEKDAQCKICKKNVKSSGNTTNLKLHLQRKHKSAESPTQQQRNTLDFERIAVNRSHSDCETLENSDASNSTVRMQNNFFLCFGSVEFLLIFIILRNSLQLDTQNDDSSTLRSASDSECATSEPQPQPKRRGYRPSQRSIKDCFDALSSFGSGGMKEKAADDALFFMITKDLQPFTIVEDVGFKHLTKTLCPLYALPSRRKVTRDFDEKFHEVANEVKKMISSGYVSITMDGWTEKHTTTNFLGITCHYLNTLTNELDSITLKLDHYSDMNHSGENILAEMVDICCNEWGIDKNNIVSITTDNAGNMLRATRLFDMDRSAGLNCIAHIFNLIVEAAIGSLPPLGPIFSKVKNIVTWFRQCVAASDMLRSLQRDAQQFPLRLIQDVQTRWNSEFDMVNRFLEVGQFVAVTMTKFKNAPPMLSGGEIETLTEIRNVLQPLEQATKMISVEKSLSASKVIPTVRCCYRGLRQVVVTNEIASELKSALLLQMDHRFADIEQNEVLLKCTALDPRFKTAYFTNTSRNKLVGLLKNGVCNN